MNPKKKFRVLVVEDSEVFNQFLTNQLKWYLGEIALHQDCDLEIDSFRSADECLENMKEDTDIAFVDYYLGEGKTGMDIVSQLKLRNNRCKVVVLSQKRTVRTEVASEDSDVEFVFKDDNVLHKSCFISEDMLNEKLKSIN